MFITNINFWFSLYIASDEEVHTRLIDIEACVIQKVKVQIVTFIQDIEKINTSILLAKK